MKKVKFPLLTPEYLRQRWVVDLASLEEIATEVGCSVGNVMKRVRDWKCFRRGTVKRISWNEGLTKDTDGRLAALSLARMGSANPMAGRPAWNRGLSPADDPRVGKMVAAMREGFESPETFHKMAVAKIGKTGELANNWKGGISEVNQYIWEGSDYQHRVRAAECLGRALVEGEEVHHMDKDRKNNDPSNLLVLDKFAHLDLHRAMSDNPELDQIKWLTDAGLKFESLT